MHEINITETMDTVVVLKRRICYSENGTLKFSNLRNSTRYRYT